MTLNLNKQNVKAVLVLEDGNVFMGTCFGAIGQTLGEIVFSTSMSGYQETITDPSYYGQIIVATTPHIGNTGWNTEDSENSDSKIWMSGYIIRDPISCAFHWSAISTLENKLSEQGIVGIAGIDTRTLARHLRKNGSMRAGIFSERVLAPTENLITKILTHPPMIGSNLTLKVSTKVSYIFKVKKTRSIAKKLNLFVLDLGIKINALYSFAKRGICSYIFPASVTFQEIVNIKPDGVFLSNGPGDPATADYIVSLTREIIEAGIPLFGICLGNQILGRALGLSTYKMIFGHRGINIPIYDIITGHVAITAQNHGFALKGKPGKQFSTQFGKAEISHICANDGVVEGIRLVNGRAFSVQYHPEATAGPHDAEYLFDQFTSLMAGDR